MAPASSALRYAFGLAGGPAHHATPTIVRGTATMRLSSALRLVAVSSLWVPVVECSEGHRTPSDSSVGPLSERQQGARATEPPPAASPDQCTPLWPAQVELRGTVRKEKRFGPPGYGEDSVQDERVTILVLELDRPINVCADTSRDFPRPAVAGVTQVQMTGRLDPERVSRSTGLKLTVYGTLTRRARGSDYTEVLIRVDSIPGLVEVARRRGDDMFNAAVGRRLRCNHS